jgi:hypothetical protein
LDLVISTETKTVVCNNNPRIVLVWPRTRAIFIYFSKSEFEIEKIQMYRGATVLITYIQVFVHMSLLWAFWLVVTLGFENKKQTCLRWTDVPVFTFECVVVCMSVLFFHFHNNFLKATVVGAVSEWVSVWL